MIYVVYLNDLIFPFDAFDDAMDFAETAKHFYAGSSEITVTIILMRDDELNKVLYN